MQDPNNPDEELPEDFDDFGDFEDVEDEGFSDMEDGALEESVPQVVGEDADADGMPPGGDFDDDDFSSEMGEFGIDDLDDPALNDDWDAEYQGAGAAPRKKSFAKSLSFNTIVVGIALIVGFGVLVYQVLTKKPEGYGAARFQSALDFTGSNDGVVLGGEKGKIENEEIVSAPEAQGGEGFLNNPDVLGTLEEETAQNDALPMPTPISNELDMEGAMQEARNAAQDTLTPLPNVDASPDINMDFGISEGTPRGPNAPGPSAEAQKEESSPALDVIRKAQSQREAGQPAPSESASPQQEVQDPPVPVQEEQEPAAVVVVSEPEPVPVVPVPVRAPDEVRVSEELMQKLDDLSDRLAAMEKQVNTLRQGGGGDVAQLEKEIAALKKEMPKAPASATPSEPAKPAAVKKAAAPKPVAAAPQWELRAAQPGRAWVSPKGSQEIQTVEPGASLKGIGKILRVEYSGGRWAVIGTQGRIDQ